MRDSVLSHHSGTAELLSGCAASLLGLAALAFTLLAPRWRVGTRGADDTDVFRYVSTLQLGQPPAFLIAFIVLALAICGFALCVMVHLRSRRHIWAGVLLGLTVLLLIWILYPLSYPTAVPLRLYYVLQDNGVFLPVLALAVVATVLAFRTPTIHLPGTDSR